MRVEEGSLSLREQGGKLTLTSSAEKKEKRGKVNEMEREREI